ncbi:hypothetical protein STURO_v1c06580 [Spiroplasma turonicum]|nr:hypothetical protein STURO_v1c06580 [Spiroplasma turonicum]
MGVVQKLIELFLLFIIGPLVAAWMVNDHGARLKQWKDMTMAKSLISIGNILSYMIMINFLTLFITNISQGTTFKDFSFIERSFVYVVVILGTCTFSLVAPQLVASFTGGEGISHEEGRNSILSAMHGGNIFKTGAKALGWAAGGSAVLGLLKGKKGKEGLSAAKSGLDNLKKGQDMMQKQRASGIPGFFGKMARATMSGAHNVKSMFSGQGWSNLGAALGGAAAGVGAAIVGNTAGVFKQKRDASNETYGETLKRNSKKYSDNYKDLKNTIKNSKKQVIKAKQKGSMFAESAKENLKFQEAQMERLRKKRIKNEKRLGKHNKKMNK